jgi:hypothetical protein
VANLGSRRFHVDGLEAVTSWLPSVIPSAVEESLIIRHLGAQSNKSEMFRSAQYDILRCQP